VFFEKIGASKGVKKPKSLIYLTNKSDRGHLLRLFALSQVSNTLIS